jgi:hypothetical protein
MKHFMRIFRTPWMCTESCAQLKNPLEQDHGRGQKHDDFHGRCYIRGVADSSLSFARFQNPFQGAQEIEVGYRVW